MVAYDKVKFGIWLLPKKVNLMPASRRKIQSPGTVSISAHGFSMGSAVW